MGREEHLKQIADNMDQYYVYYIELEVKRQHKVLFDDIIVKGVAIYDNGAIAEAKENAYNDIENLLSNMVMKEEISEEERDFIVEHSKHLDR